MRIKIALLTALMIVIPFAVLADESMELQKRIILDQKKLVVMDNMSFTEEEAKSFWPIYDKHQETLFQINQRAAKLIIAYAAVYQTLTDDQAVKILDEYFAMRQERLDTMKSFSEDLEKVLTGKKAFRYMQIENKLEAIARAELAKEIPLAQ